jgi:putative membrane protein
MRAMSGYLWVKALHIVFVSSWFAGLFYLPRIFVNLAQVPSDSHAERERLLLMARKLYRFSSFLMLGAIGLGIVLVVMQPAWLRMGWLHAKLLLVVVAIGYHHMCRGKLRSFEKLENRRPERWFRVFNEMAVLLFAAIVVLVVVKPF